MYKFVQKIGEALLRVGKDRYVHLLVSLVLTCVLIAIFGLCGLGNYGFAIAPAVVLLLGAWKEYMDQKQKIGDVYDLVFDFLGVFTGMVILALFLAAFVG